MVLLNIYIVGAIMLVIMGLLWMGMCAVDGARMTNPARMLLSAPIWPLLIPVTFYWLVCVAFEREFPTFEVRRRRID